MPLTRNQKIELKRIDANYSKLEKLSIKTGISLDIFLMDSDYRFPNNRAMETTKAGKQSEDRKKVFGNHQSEKPIQHD